MTIHGARSYLWRAVEQDDNVLDILVPSAESPQQESSEAMLKKLLKGLCYVPYVLITDELKSYAPAKGEVMPGVEHRQSRYLNNRWEFSHRPTRERKRRMQRFTSPGHAQRFLSAYGPIIHPLRPRRHLLAASAYWQKMRQRFETWREIAAVVMAAEGARRVPLYDLYAW